MVFRKGEGVTNNNLDLAKTSKRSFRVVEIQEGCFASKFSPTTETWTGC